MEEVKPEVSVLNTPTETDIWSIFKSCYNVYGAWPLSDSQIKLIRTLSKYVEDRVANRETSTQVKIDIGSVMADNYGGRVVRKRGRPRKIT
jgi:adenylosuccinate synthase